MIRRVWKTPADGSERDMVALERSVALNAPDIARIEGCNSIAWFLPSLVEVPAALPDGARKASMAAAPP